MNLHKKLKRIFMARQGRIDETIQKHGAMAVFEAGAAGECEDFAPLRELGLTVETIANAEAISWAAYDRLTVEEKAALHWEASRDLYKNREPVNWDDMDFTVGPRLLDESEADYLHRQTIVELIRQQAEAR